MVIAISIVFFLSRLNMRKRLLAARSRLRSTADW
jgi:hypothetical protein